MLYLPHKKPQRCFILHKPISYTQVDDQPIPVGFEQEPVYITVIYGEGLQFSQGYCKTCTLQEVKVIVCNYIRAEPENLQLLRVFGKGERLVKITKMCVYV